MTPIFLLWNCGRGRLDEEEKVVVVVVVVVVEEAKKDEVKGDTHSLSEVTE